MEAIHSGMIQKTERPQFKSNFNCWNFNRYSKRERKRFRNRLDVAPEWKDLAARCLAPIRSFASIGEVSETPSGMLVYKDNSADVLAVAHLDTVQRTSHFGRLPEYPGRVYSGQLDDRLGVYVILDLLPLLGINCDVLLTEGEEKCQSTAQYFKPPKQYKWMIEFDRAGSDVVTYQYDDSELARVAIECKNEIDCGMYSDICNLGHLGCAGLNWGIGYHDHHSYEAYFDIAEFTDAISRFRVFWESVGNRSFPWKESEKMFTPRRSVNRNGYLYMEICERCGKLINEYEIYKGNENEVLCEDCYCKTADTWEEKEEKQEWLDVAETWRNIFD